MSTKKSFRDSDLDCFESTNQFGENGIFIIISLPIHGQNTLFSFFRLYLIPFNILHFSLKRSPKNFIGSSAMYLIYFMLLKIHSWSTIPLYHWKMSSFISFIASDLFVWYYYSYTRLLWVNAISFYFYFLVLVYLRWFSYKYHVIRFYFFIQSNNNNILLLVFSLLSYVYCSYHFTIYV